MLDEKNTGTIFDIQRFSVHDGPGIRTTVFLKGCPLRCAWCQNPEGLERRVRVWCFEKLCAGCGRCLTVCPRHALHPGENGKPAADQDRCIQCGACVEECDRNALALDGREIAAEALAEKLLEDRVFFAASGGGVTFSGGEPLAQAEFVGAVAEKMKANGIATAMETSLDAPWETIAALIPVIDFFQADVKLIDPVRHRQATGRDNAVILDNFRRLAAGLEHPEQRLRPRLPLAPGYTADAANIREVASFIAGVHPLLTLELLNFNPLAEAKYRRMPEKQYPLAGAKQYSDAEMEAFRKIAGAHIRVL